jgi:hypothetical protein
VRNLQVNFIDMDVRNVRLSRHSEGLRVGRPGVRFLVGSRIILFSTSSRPALGPTQPPIQCVPGAVSPGVKRPGRKGYYSPPPSADVKDGGALPPLRNTCSWHCA